MHLGVCYQLEKLWRPSPWLLFTSIGPPPQPATPRRGHWGHPGNCHKHLYSSPKKVYTHYITLLFYFNWIWRRSLKFAKFWPLGALPLGPHCGHMYHMNTCESPAPEDDSCQVWLKSNHAFLQEVDEVTFDIGPPPQPVTPQGPLGPPWELPPTTFILHLRRYLHFT